MHYGYAAGYVCRSGRGKIKPENVRLRLSLEELLDHNWEEIMMPLTGIEEIQHVHSLQLIGRVL